MSRTIKDGNWITINSQAEFDRLCVGRCNRGRFIRPGNYLQLTYYKRCPRN